LTGLPVDGHLRNSREAKIIERRYQMVHKKTRKPAVMRLINSAAIIAHIFMALILLAGCLSYYNKVDQYDYARVRDYVSFKVSGMSYSQLEKELDTGRKIRLENKRSEIYSKLNVLVNDYQKAETSEDFYRWTLSNYDFLFYDE
jgi:hypothetical protein